MMTRSKARRLRAQAEALGVGASEIEPGVEIPPVEDQQPVQTVHIGNQSSPTAGDSSLDSTLPIEEDSTLPIEEPEEEMPPAEDLQRVQTVLIENQSPTQAVPTGSQSSPTVIVGDASLDSTLPVEEPSPAPTLPIESPDAVLSRPLTSPLLLQMPAQLFHTP